MAVAVLGPRRLSRAFAGVLLATLGFTTRADAQLKIEIAPAFGGYLPTRPLPQAGTLLFSGDEVLPPHRLQQERAGGLGGRVAVWFNQRSAVEAAFGYAPSTITDDPAYASPGGGAVTTASLRYVFRVDPDLPVLSLLLMAGPAIVRRSGDAWAGLTGTTSPALGLGIGIDAFPASGIGLRGEVSDYLYNVHLSGDSDVGSWNYSDASAFQQDLIISLALSLRP
jgi:hypothetical protein